MALIYIVEDDANICEIESIALTNSGHEVESSANSAFLSKTLKRINKLWQKSQ